MGSRQMVTPKTAVEMLVIGMVTVRMGCTDIEMGAKEKKTSNLSRQMVTPKTAVEMLVIGMVTVSMGMEMVIVRTDCTDIEMVIVRTDCTDIEMGAKETKTLNLRRQMILKTAVEMLVIGLVTVSMGTEMVIVRTDGTDIEMGAKEKKTTNLSRQMVTPKKVVKKLGIEMV